MSTQYHAVINCQSTDLNGLPTSIDVVLTQYDVNKVVDRFYCEISGYNESIKYSDVANKMFEKIEGADVVTPEWAIYNLYQFLAKHGAMTGGVFRPVVYGFLRNLPVILLHVEKSIKKRVETRFFKFEI